MGSGGGGGGTGERGGGARRRTRQPTRPTTAPAPKPIVTDVREAALGKKAEVGVRYTPSGATIGKVSDYRPGGVSPGEVMATVGAGAVGGLAGRTDVTVEGLGDLAKRINVGQLPAGEIKIPGAGTVAMNVLNIAGKKMATTTLEKLVAGEKAVTDPSGRIMGTVGEGGAYTGRTDFKPTTIMAAGEPEPVRADVTPEITPEITPEVTALADETVLGRGRRRTKRAGPAGTMEEIGVLVRGGSPRATV
jgi:hypothetical protein